MRPTVEQVAEALSDDWNPHRDPVLTAMFRDYATTVLALFEPQTVSTAEELDALPVGSIVMDGDYDVMHKVWGAPSGGDDYWAQMGSEHESNIWLPATVIYRPESEDR